MNLQKITSWMQQKLINATEIATFATFQPDIFVATPATFATKTPFRGFVACCMLQCPTRKKLQVNDARILTRKILQVESHA